MKGSLGWTKPTNPVQNPLGELRGILFMSQPTADGSGALTTGPALNSLPSRRTNEKVPVRRPCATATLCFSSSLSASFCFPSLHLCRSKDRDSDGVKMSFPTFDAVLVTVNDRTQTLHFLQTPLSHFYQDPTVSVRDSSLQNHLSTSALGHWKLLGVPP